MLKRFLLHFTHDLVGVVDGGGDLRTIAVFHFHRFGQMGIGGPHLEFERLAACGKTLLDCLDLCFLCDIEFELAVQQGVEFGLALPLRCEQDAASISAAQRRRKCDKRDQDQPRGPIHGWTSSKVEGARGLSGAKGEIG